MKHNQANLKEARRTKTAAGKSKYAKKVRANNQMYGPGCCAHTRQPRTDYSLNRLRCAPEPHESEWYFQSDPKRQNVA